MYNKAIFILTYKRPNAQHTIKTQEGCITETYLNQGTYKKSFSAHIVAPSVLSLDVMGRRNFRIHHKLNYKRMPQIINGKYKKQ